MCNSEIESIDHLFFLCPVANQVWCHFIGLFQFPDAPRSMSHLWGQWRLTWPKDKRVFGDLVSKSIVWNVWLARNDCLFKDIFTTVNCIIMKTVRLIHFWLSSIADSPRERCEEDISMVRRSLDFLGPRVLDADLAPHIGDDHTLEEI
ncbi:hypothetical protein IHE45_07G070600 [Dioscorea alata]|uniref:Uncharacterized protein n=1 Tax=Dioscorea alata TaxID=55571 RepID=A0ACB7VS53_DIOAL|nr:hypothetical protein IHE45_07G070600 [Dioscorea alata]